MLNKVRIDTQDYDINIADGPIVVNNELCDGSISLPDCVIMLNKECKARYRQILMHELIHGIMMERRFDNLVGEENKEMIVEQMALGMVNLLNDNPKLVNYFIGGTEIGDSIIEK